MTKWDWVRSAVIFVIAVFIFNDFFISLTIGEAIILTLFLGVCVFHVIDIREDIVKKLAKKRCDQKNKEEARGNDGSEGSV